MTSLFRKGTISKDPKLLQDLERYYKIRAAASRILSIAQNPLQRLDAAKTLLVSHAQLLSYALHPNLSSSNLLTKEIPIINGTVSRKTCLARPGYAQLCLSDVRIPLLWRNIPPGTNIHLAMQQLFPQSSSIVSGLLPTVVNASGDNTDISDSKDQFHGYSLFCTIQVGHVILDSRLIFDIKPGTANIEFNDKWIFDDVTSEFECIIEIYAFPKGNGKSNSLFSKRRFSSAYEIGKKVIDQYDVDSLISQNSSHYFDLIGRCVANIKDVNNKVSSHALEVGGQLLYPPESKNLSSMLPSNTTSQKNHLFNDQLNEMSEVCDLPLFGNICYRLIAQPHSTKLPLKSGYIWIRKLTPSPIQSPMMLYYCELQDRFIFATLMSTSCSIKSSYGFSSLDHEIHKLKSTNHIMEPHVHRLSITPEDIPVSDDPTIKTVSSSKKKSREKKHLNNPELSSTPANSRRIISVSDDSDHFSSNNSSSSEKNGDQLLRNLRHPDLMIPIHPKTNFLDPQPVVRQIELATCGKSSQAIDISQTDSNTSAKCYIPSPNNGSQSNLGIHHPEIKHVPPIERKRALSTVDISCLSHSFHFEDPLYTQSFFSSCKTGLLNSQSVDNLYYPTKIENSEGLQDKSVLGLQSDNSSKQLYTRSTTKVNGLPSIEDKGESLSRSSLSPLMKRCRKRILSPIDTRKRTNRISRSVEPVGRLLSKEISACNVDIANSFDFTELRKLQYLSSQSSECSSHIPICDTVKNDNTDSDKSQVYSSQLLTFRIATCPLNGNIVSHEHHSAELVHDPVNEVFEFTVTKVFGNDPMQLDDSSGIFEYDEKEVLAWFSIIKNHIKEQEVWGSEAFSKNISIPKTTSNSIRNTSARRSIAFSNDFTITSN
ncbi:unnamed protein product [Heterobilharzia americana]|nr:unnamed protein product [Heterobilharzia americana]